MQDAGAIHLNDRPPSLDLPALPNDVILLVTSSLCPIRGLYASPEAEAERQVENMARQKALHSLTLSCRRFHGLIQSLLFQSFIQYTADTHSARLLVRTLLERPDLRKHIQYVETTYTDMTAQSIPAQSMSTTVNQALPFDQAVHDQWQDFQQHFAEITWAPNLQDHKPFEWFHYEYKLGRAWVDGNPQAHIAFIMAIVPNLCEVAIFDLQILYTATLTSRRYHSIKALRKLWLGQRASTRERSSGRPLRVTSIVNQAIKVGFPLSEHLTLVNAYSYLIPASYDPIPNPWFWGSDSLGLLNLTLDACELSPTHLQQLLSKYTSLKRFSCRWGVSLAEVDNLFPQIIDLPSLNTALSSSKNTLEYLFLDTRNSGYNTLPAHPIPPIGSLCGFSVLKHLDVCSAVLWGHGEQGRSSTPCIEHLPAHIETLVLRGEWTTALEDFLLEMSGKSAEWVPELRCIDCSLARTRSSTAISSIRKRLDDVNIELRL